MVETLLNVAEVLRCPAYRARRAGRVSPDWLSQEWSRATLRLVELQGLTGLDDANVNGASLGGAIFFAASLSPRSCWLWVAHRGAAIRSRGAAQLLRGAYLTPHQQAAALAALTEWDSATTVGLPVPHYSVGRFCPSSYSKKCLILATPRSTASAFPIAMVALAAGIVGFGPSLPVLLERATDIDLGAGEPATGITADEPRLMRKVETFAFSRHTEIVDRQRFHW